MAELTPDGMTPSEQLAAIRPVALELMNGARSCLQTLWPLLDHAGIHILDYLALDEEQKRNADAYFEEIIFPVLTPLAYDPGRPLPHISNMSMDLAVTINDENENERFARVKVPNTLPRLLPVKEANSRASRDGMESKERHLFGWSK